MMQTKEVVLAVGAHPDDIEFMMGGTLLLLGQAGHELHCLPVANGSCGTSTLSREEIVSIREEEARNAARFLNATYHRSFVNDIDIFYERALLAKVGAIIREVRPTIVFVPAPDDYMEDHVNASRLAVTATFCRGMRNFQTSPDRPPFDRNVVVYHALPYGLRDLFSREVRAERYVDITPVIAANPIFGRWRRCRARWARSRGASGMRRDGGGITHSAFPPKGAIRSGVRWEKRRWSSTLPFEVTV